MAIQIGKYKRPGIFIEEFDNSVISTPTVTGTTTLVVGFSKKGPVNTPVLLNNVTDLENIFGTLDRNLERKGSFFYRTISKMLESSPVYAINLLNTSDILDTIEYKSVSTRTDKSNDSVRSGSYRRFFDTTSFWKRDTDSYLSLISSDSGQADRLMSFTNMSDKYVTVFVFKSQISGYDIPMIQYYGTVDKIPAYVNQLDYASDYMLDVVIVGGDWSNYQQLSVDNTWSQYFTSLGLIKSQISNFANNRNVNLLAYYEGVSLIPYFRDNNGRNIFIETIINNDTDRTGVFCAFDSDKLEADFPNGMVDLIGNNLVDSSNPLILTGQTTIDFLSYNATIIDSLSFSQVRLDRADGTQQVIALGPNLSDDVRGQAWESTYRTAHYAEKYINGVSYASASAIFSSTASIQLGFTVTDASLGGGSTTSAYCVIGGSTIPINGGVNDTYTFSISKDSYVTSTSTQSFTSVFYINASTGTIEKKEGTTNGVNPSLSSNDLVLGYVDFSTRNGYFATSSIDYTHVGINSNGYRDLILDETKAISTWAVSATGNSGTVSFSFTDPYLGATSGVYTFSSPNTTSTFAEGLAVSLSNITGYSATSSGATISFTSRPTLGEVINGTTFSLDIQIDQVSGLTTSGISAGNFSGGVSPYTITTSGTEVTIEFNDTASTDQTNNYERHRKISLFNSLIGVLDSSDRSKATYLSNVSPTYSKASLEGSTLEYVSSSTSNKSLTIDLGATVSQSILDDNFILYKTDDEFLLGELGTNTRLTVATPSYGVIGKESDFYSSYYAGTIGTGDYLYKNITSENNRTVFINTGTNSYVVLDTSLPSTNEYSVISVPGSTLNTGTYALNGEYDATLLTDPLTGTAFSGYTAYNISGSNVVDEDLTSISTIYDRDTKVYLKLYLDDSSNLIAKFMDSALSSTEPINLTYDKLITVISNKSNYRQSIEIESATGYTASVNKILINGTRYTEVKVGDFLEADVDSSSLETGQKGRYLTRILSKKLYTADTTLVEITCDAAIKKVAINGEYQTTRFTTIDDYVTTYQAIPLKGFRVREDSMPDGTDTRQSSLLNLIAKGTPLFKALTNKESIDFRYLVDSFGLGMTERSKQQLVDVCGERLDCIGFISMPSMKMFKNSTNPSFLNSDGVLDTSYIAAGGNLESNPSFLYSFGDGNGSTSVGYFLPYVTVSDNGRPIDVPPAPYVATTYMRKQNSNTDSIVPWTIAAGVTNGKVSNISGLEINFTPTDIENLNLAQMNPIVYKRNRGFIIETENTALTLYKSALSYLHVREVLIELERELSSMLLEFQWKFNTSDVRAEIKLRADIICEKYINRNGLYAYFNKCDEENNTSNIIDNQIGILDTFVEPIKGMGVVVNNITILRTGGITSGGFQ